MMPQDPFFFNRSVIYNLRYANLDATIDEIQKACRGANIHDTIASRKGQYEAPMGENGRNFSGGERQRLALARMFILSPNIVLIDEGTSALDANTEATIKQRIEQEFAHKTVITVTHRLSSIRQVDRILVLEDGCKIVEDGNHDELVALDGKYTKYWNIYMLVRHV